jgi:hypothetical protein
MRGEGGRGVAGSQANDSMSTAVSCAHGAQINNSYLKILTETLSGWGGGGNKKKNKVIKTAKFLDSTIMLC